MATKPKTRHATEATEQACPRCKTPVKIRAALKHYTCGQDGFCVTCFALHINEHECGGQ